MTSMTHASAESPTALDRYRRDRARLGGSVRDADAGSARIDRDSRLLDALRQGEPTAAEELVATYGNRAYRLAMWITGKGQDAEEAVQDAFWSVIRKIDTFRGNSAFGSWIYRRAADVNRRLARSWWMRFSWIGRRPSMTRQCDQSFGLC